MGGNSDSEGGTCVVALQAEQSWGGRQGSAAAVKIALPYAGVPANVTVFVGQFGHSEDSGRILVASLCVPVRMSSS